jgi:hypothetical protein
MSMDLNSRTEQAGASIHDNHYCDHEGCKRWGCYGFEESRSITLWYCAEHQPLVYKGLARHGEARLPESRSAK